MPRIAIGQRSSKWKEEARRISIGLSFSSYGSYGGRSVLPSRPPVRPSVRPSACVNPCFLSGIDDRQIMTLISARVPCSRRDLVRRDFSDQYISVIERSAAVEWTAGQESNLYSAPLRWLIGQKPRIYDSEEEGDVVVQSVTIVQCHVIWCGGSRTIRRRSLS